MNLELIILALNVAKEGFEAIKANMGNDPNKNKETQEALIAILLFIKKIMESSK